MPPTSAGVQPFIPPLQTRNAPPVGGHIGDAPEDFFVEEIPAYDPSGAGDHVYLFVEKRQQNTRDVARALAERCGSVARDVGYAGMKDRQAVTRQWFSLPPGAKTENLEQAAGEGWKVLSVSRHKNKLRTGHLIGNRFRIILRDVPEGGLSRAEKLASDLNAHGLDNYFGPQRFGREGKNLDQAFAWLGQELEAGDSRAPGRGKRKGRRQPRGADPKLLSSVIQSEVFNRYAAKRLALDAGLLSGEVVRLRGTGSHFVVEDPKKELSRFEEGDLLLTGPMIGPKGLQASSEARELERCVSRELGLSEELLARLGAFAPGTRRDLKLFPEELSVEEVDPASIAIRFRLPAGAFATQLMRELTHTAWDSPRIPGGA